ncbi:MAG: hypothetical protein Q9163_005918, partial [Psora crenata]
MSTTLAPPDPKHQDKIFLRALHIEATLGGDAWHRPQKPQPITLSLTLTLPHGPGSNGGSSSSSATTTDDITHTFSYGKLCSDLTAALHRAVFPSLAHLTASVVALADSQGEGAGAGVGAWPGDVLEVVALAPKGLLRVEGGLGRELVLVRGRRTSEEEDERSAIVPAGGGPPPHRRCWHVHSHAWTVSGLRLACIVGVNPHERLEKQAVGIDLRVWAEHEPKHQEQEQAQAQQQQQQQQEGGAKMSPRGTNEQNNVDPDVDPDPDPELWRRTVSRLCEVVEASSFHTLEALA